MFYLEGDIVGSVLLFLYIREGVCSSSKLSMDTADGAKEE